MVDIKIRQGKKEDLGRLYEIEKSSVDAWSYEILKQDLINNDLSVYFVAEMDLKIIGFISIMNISGEVHINNIIVDENYRGIKTGVKLLKYGMNYFSKDSVFGYTLEVREDNKPAINLYEKFGFKIVGKRKNYYKNNKSAFIMWKLD